MAHRWIAIVTYQSDNGPIEVDHHFEELHDLHEIVERGPDWNTIVDIRITLNPACRSYEGTIEQADRIAKGEM